MKWPPMAPEIGGARGVGKKEEGFCGIGTSFGINSVNKENTLPYPQPDPSLIYIFNIYLTQS